MKIIFFGTPEFAIPSMEMLLGEGYGIHALVTQPDRPRGRGRKVCFPPAKEFAAARGIEVLQPANIRDREFIEKMGELEPDLFITAAYGRILPERLLNIPPMGCINVHASLLPKYRGAAPCNWAIINGEKKTGVTTMQTDRGMDTGDMLLKDEMDIDPHMDAGELEEKLSHLGAVTLKRTLVKLLDGTLKRIPQNHDEATYAPPMTKDMGKIDWNKTALEIHNLVRGVTPWPGAYNEYQGRKIKIWKTQLLEKDPDNSYDQCQLGTVCEKSTDGVIVKCKDGYIKLMEIQFEGMKRLCIKSCWHNFECEEIMGGL